MKLIAEAEVLKNVTELKSSLRLVGYCSKFIPLFSDIAEPFRRLTLATFSNSLVTFNKEDLAAFKKLKKDFSSSETLEHFGIFKDTTVHSCKSGRPGCHLDTISL